MWRSLELRVRKSVTYCKPLWWELERQELSVHSGAWARVVSEGSEEGSFRREEWLGSLLWHSDKGSGGVLPVS